LRRNKPAISIQEDGHVVQPDYEKPVKFPAARAGEQERDGDHLHRVQKRPGLYRARKLRPDKTALTVNLQETWWRNLRGAPVTIRLRGRELKAKAEVIEDEYAVATNLVDLLKDAPGYARYLQVKFSPDGQPDFTDVCRAAEGRVIVRTVF
jgi:hypothetical protein